MEEIQRKNDIQGFNGPQFQIIVNGRAVDAAQGETVISALNAVGLYGFSENNHQHHRFGALLPRAIHGRKLQDGKHSGVLATLGDHVRTRRLDLGLEQTEVAQRFGVCTETVLHWEKNQRQVPERCYPIIMEFLGYCPYTPPASPITFGARLRTYAHHAGYSIKTLAKALGADEKTVAGWAKDEMLPKEKHVPKLKEVLGLEVI